MNNNKLLDYDGLSYYKQKSDALLAAKQDTLVSGTNIKTINNESILGGGNIAITGEVYVIDNTPQANSNHLVSSGGVASEIVWDVTARNSNATFASLSALLSDASLDTLIPTTIRRGGMQIRFVCSSDNKYVQYRCVANEFTTDITQWQGAASEIKEDSIDLVEGGTIEKYLAHYTTTINNPTYTSGDVQANDGSVATRVTYGYVAPILLKAGHTIKMNKGDALYTSRGTAILYITDANGVWQSTIVAGDGTTKIVSYTNETLSDMYVGICTEKTLLSYIITHLDIAASEIKVEGINSNMILGWIVGECYYPQNATYTDGVINSPVNVKWPDNSSGTLTITRNDDGLVTSIVATYNSDTYNITVIRDSDGNATSASIVKQ